MILKIECFFYFKPVATLLANILYGSINKNIIFVCIQNIVHALLINNIAIFIIIKVQNL